MLNKILALPLLALSLSLLVGDTRNAAFARSSLNDGDIVGHVIAGYQGWFAAPGDGSPVGDLPTGKGNYHDNYETYPDMREFPDREQFTVPKGWSALPNGNPARILSSNRDATTDIHARWMKQYGVDVAAIQRFGEVAREPTQAAQKNDLTRRLMRACERHGVKFYIEYDTSGSGRDGWGPDFVKGVQDDWNRFAVAEKIIGSTAYARQNGKPVVELWGMGLHDNGISTDPAKWLTLVNWFKKRGVYVIAGTATGWRTNDRDAVPGFEAVYAASDAISPWMVGRISTIAGTDDFAHKSLIPDFDWCKAHHVDYIPCIYPGTSFFNSNGRTKNIIPRRNGELMWRQFANLRSAGISTCFISMFDEYNEATAIAKSAEDVSMVPAHQWFLTLDADGADLSSDYYLRLTADGGRMLKGITPLQWTPPTPHRNDLFLTSFEDGQPQPGNATFSTDRPQRGSRSLVYDGDVPSSGGAVTRKLFDFTGHPLTLSRNSLFYYWLLPQNPNGRYVALSLHFTNGTTLSTSRCTDQNGRPLRASAGHGGTIALNTWTPITAWIGDTLAGKKIDSIWAIYNHPGGSGPFRCKIDDIEITR